MVQTYLLHIVHELPRLDRLRVRLMLMDMVTVRVKGRVTVIVSIATRVRVRDRVRIRDIVRGGLLPTNSHSIFYNRVGQIAIFNHCQP